MELQFHPKFGYYSDAQNAVKCLVTPGKISIHVCAVSAVLISGRQIMFVHYQLLHSI